jgi:hypothetical protein
VLLDHLGEVALCELLHTGSVRKSGPLELLLPSRLFRVKGMPTEKLMVVVAAV